jgi:hypothetical protein
MSPQYSYQPHNAHRRPLHAHPLQEPQVEAEEVEAEEVEAEEVEVEEEEEAEERIPLTSDYVETPPRYSREKERKQTASSPNSNATI